MKRKRVFITLLIIVVSLLCSQSIFADNSIELFSANQGNTDSMKTMEQPISAIEQIGNEPLKENVEKVSPNEKILTKGNVLVKRTVKSEENLVSICPEQYELGGAEYTIYSDQSCSISVGTLTCTTQQKDATGKLYSESQAIELENGTYYIKETKRSKGYKPDDLPYHEVVINGNSSILDIAVTPKFESMNMSMTFQATYDRYINDVPKRIVSKPEYQKYFEGICLEICYYPSYYSNVDEAKLQEPLRKWIFRADKNGQIRYDDAWKQTTNLQPSQRCDELFKDENGNPVGLYGTYVFKQLDNPNDCFSCYGNAELKQLIEDKPFEDLNALNTDSLDVDEPNPTITIINRVPLSVIEGYEQAFLGNAEYAIYCLEGTNIFGEKVKEYKAIDPTDYKHEKAEFWIMMGSYTIKEVERSRYDGVIRRVTNGCKVEGDVIRIAPLEKDETINFRSVARRWDYFSYCRMMINEYIPL